MKPSPYQQNIYNATIATNKHLSIQATAGSGKTTTIVQAAKLVPYGKKAVFLAFNKSIVLELKKKLPPVVDCSTMHSLGSKCIFAFFPGEKTINDNKQIKFIEPFFKDEKSMRRKWVDIYAIDRLIRLARATMTPAHKDEFEVLAINYALDVSQKHIDIGVKAMRRFHDDNDDPDKWNIYIDFQDMIEMPVRNREIRMPQYDFVFVDEAQDLSKLDQLFINRLVKPITGRKIIVGDENQSIYGFRGSDPNSFEEFSNAPNTLRLPLSISYRCAKAIVREAKLVYNDIEEFEENEEGIVAKGEVKEIQEGDMVLCRNTRPLIAVFLMLIDQGKKAYIVGKEMEKGLLQLLSQYDSDSRTTDIKAQLDCHLDRLAEELLSKGFTNPLKHPKYAVLEEKLGILDLLFGKFSLISEVEFFIETVFDDDDREGIRLMTIHKSKGLENERVFIIVEYNKTPLIPSKYAVTEDQQRQEKNLRFVSITRAKRELYYLYL